MIKNVVFDIGRVLVDFSFEPFREFLFENGAKLETTAEFVSKSGLIEYEQGQIDSTEFLTRVQQLLDQPVAAEDLADRWTQIFSPIHSMLEVIPLLRKRHRVFLLSNTNELHWEHLETNLSLGACVDGVIASFRVGAMKPSAEIYDYAERTHSLLPRETVFIDDLADNVQGAVRRGWHGITHSEVDLTLAELRKLGVDGLS